MFNKTIFIFLVLIQRGPRMSILLVLDQAERPTVVREFRLETVE